MWVASRYVLGLGTRERMWLNFVPCFMPRSKTNRGCLPILFFVGSYTNGNQKNMPFQGNYKMIATCPSRDSGMCCTCVAGSDFGVQERFSSVGVLWLWGGSSAAVGFRLLGFWLLTSSLFRLTLKHFTHCCPLCTITIFSA